MQLVSADHMHESQDTKKPKPGARAKQVLRLEAGVSFVENMPERVRRGVGTNALWSAPLFTHSLGRA